MRILGRSRSVQRLRRVVACVSLCVVQNNFLIQIELPLTSTSLMNTLELGALPPEGLPAAIGLKFVDVSTMKSQLLTTLARAVLWVGKEGGNFKVRLGKDFSGWI